MDGRQAGNEVDPIKGIANIDPGDNRILRTLRTRFVHGIVARFGKKLRIELGQNRLDLRKSIGRDGDGTRGDHVHLLGRCFDRGRHNLADQFAGSLRGNDGSLHNLASARGVGSSLARDDGEHIIRFGDHQFHDGLRHLAAVGGLSKSNRGNCHRTSEERVVESSFHDFDV